MTDIGIDWSEAVWFATGILGMAVWIVINRKLDQIQKSLDELKIEVDITLNLLEKATAMVYDMHKKLLGEGEGK